MEEGGSSSTKAGGTIMVSKILALPREIMVDIVLRLPISSLLQIKLVCKPWRRILHDPNLPSLHFSRVVSTVRSDPCLILQASHTGSNKLFFLDSSSLVKEDHDDVNAGGDNKLKKLVVPSKIPNFFVLDSCRGILCLRNRSHRSTMYLYNPLLAELKEIPNTMCGPNFLLGFGFHSETKEYKLVTIEAEMDRATPYFQTHKSSDSTLFVKTLQTSARNGARPDNNEPTAGRWRPVGSVPYRFVSRDHQVLVSNRLHWIAFHKTRRPKKRVILSIDLSDETIREVSNMPRSICSCERNCKCRFELMVVGSSCLGVVEYDHVRGEIKVWVMKDYGVEESWVDEIKIRGINEYDRDETTSSSSSRRNKRGLARGSGGGQFYGTWDLRVLWVMRNGEVVLEYKRRGLVCYDPRNGSFRDVLSQGDEGLFFLGFDAFVHQGSFCGIDACINM